MAPTDDTSIPGPVLHEPVFSEGTPTHDPAGFLQRHPSDGASYAKLGDLLETQVVAVPKPRWEHLAYTLAEAYGPRGGDVTSEIEGRGASSSTRWTIRGQARSSGTIMRMSFRLRTG